VSKPTEVFFNNKGFNSMTKSSPSPARFEDPLTLFSRAGTKLHSLWLRAMYPFAAAGKKLSIHFTCRLSRKAAHQMRIGNSVIIRKDAWLNIPVEAGAAGVKIIIEDNCLIGARNLISARNLIHIERDVMMGTSVLIQDHHHAYEDVLVPIRDQGCTPGGRIRIEQGCWIGQGAAIVCNEGELVIGRNSVIASNALVTRSFPPNSVLVGNPARLARQFSPIKGAWVGGEAGRSGASGNGDERLSPSAQSRVAG
jgi:acetyltransferase-like isoleucine patch superfamily enzyme